MLLKGVISDFLGSPWNVAFPNRKWCELEVPFRVAHDQMFDAFRNWVRRNSLNDGKLSGMKQFVRQMNITLDSRTRLRHVRKIGDISKRISVWNIPPLNIARTLFARLYTHVNFADEEAGRRSLMDSYLTDPDDDGDLCRPIPELNIRGFDTEPGRPLPPSLTRRRLREDRMVDSEEEEEEMVGMMEDTEEDSNELPLKKTCP